MEREKIIGLIKKESVFETREEGAKNNIRLWWNFSKSSSLNQSQKQSVGHTLKKYVAPNGVLVINCSKQSTVPKNKQECLITMTRLVSHALKSGKLEFKQNRSKQQKDTLIRKGKTGSRRKF